MKFLLSSGVLHVALFAAAMMVGTWMPKPPIPDLTEITILDSAPLDNSGPYVAPESPAAAVQAAAPEPEQAVVKVPTVVPKAVKIKAAAPQTITDVAAPALETDDIEKTLKSDVKIQDKNLDEKDISEDLDKVDNENSAQVNSFKKEIDQETAGALAEQQKNLAAAQAQTQKQDEALAKQEAEMKAADQARVQNAVAQEKAAAKAAADKAAAEKAAQIAAQKAAAEKARLEAERVAAAQAAAAQVAAQRAEAERTAAANRAEAERVGAAKRAAAQQAAAARYAKDMALGQQLGVNAPVHTLEDLRQAPGNKHPEYANEDRLAGHQGDVSFLAYVGQDGRVSQFKILKSSGYRSLDAKTFAAIRSWKFYPGQEGWVEIPFRWDLKGGPQEMASTLRRSSHN